MLTLLFAAQLTLGFFGVTFHLRAQEDLREELVMKLQKNYNEVGGEYFSPALDYIQTKVNNYVSYHHRIIEAVNCNFARIF